MFGFIGFVPLWTPEGTQSAGFQISRTCPCKKPDIPSRGGRTYDTAVNIYSMKFQAWEKRRSILQPQNR